MDFIWLNWFNPYHLPLTLILTILGHCKIPLWGWIYIFFWTFTTSNSVSRKALWPIIKVHQRFTWLWQVFKVSMSATLMFWPMTSCRVILISWLSIFRCKCPTTFELCYAILKNFTTDQCCFFYEEAVITNKTFLTYRKLSDLLQLPHLLVFFSSCLSDTLPLTALHLLISLLLGLCSTLHQLSRVPMKIISFFCQFVLLKILTFRWPIRACSMLVAEKGIVTIVFAKPSTTFTWTCQQHSWTLIWINGRLKHLRSEFNTPCCTHYFLCPFHI